MGQKVNPNGFRTGINKDWNATWVAPKKEIATYILEDHKIRKLLNDQYGLKAGLNNCSISRIAIERRNSIVTVNIYTSQPGMLIGQKGANIQVLNQKIQKLDHFGRGIIKQEQDIIFVEDTLPGDIVDISIVKQKKNIKEAIVDKYIDRSKNYQDSLCPYSKTCGGCNIINLLYQEQLTYKKQKVQELIDKMLKEDIEIKEIINSNQEYNYRNKITIHSKNNILGLYKKKTNDIVEIDGCKLVNHNINNILKRIKNYQKNHS
jgi:ribosomal protein S3